MMKVDPMVPFAGIPSDSHDALAMAASPGGPTGRPGADPDVRGGRPSDPSGRVERR
jgi:hypothetical protein